MQSFYFSEHKLIVCMPLYIMTCHRANIMNRIDQFWQLDVASIAQWTEWTYI